MSPSYYPTIVPSEVPSETPSQNPSTLPSLSPTSPPTRVPSHAPSATPTLHPSNLPSALPSAQPTAAPTVFPTAYPTGQPSASPSALPTRFPSASPTVHFPTALPTTAPTSPTSDELENITSALQTGIADYIGAQDVNVTEVQRFLDEAAAVMTMISQDRSQDVQIMTAVANGGDIANPSTRPLTNEVRLAESIENLALQLAISMPIATNETARVLSMTASDPIISLTVAKQQCGSDDNITFTSNAFTDQLITTTLPDACIALDSSDDFGVYLMIEFNASDLFPSQVKVNNNVQLLGDRILMISLNTVGESLPYQSGQTFAGGVKMTYTMPYGDYSASFEIDDPCQFYNHSDGNQLPFWDRSGCAKSPDSNATHIVCECTHCTSFGVLMGGSGGPDGSSASNADAAHSTALSYLTYGGISISIVCFILILMAYTIFPKARTPSKVILMNLCFCLLAMMVLFIISTAGRRQGTVTGTGCQAVGVGLHYFLIAAFAWMLIEGVHLHRTFVYVFNVTEMESIHRDALIAYGVPGLYVGALAGAFPQEYGDVQSGTSCYISNKLILSVILPVLLIATVNIILFAKIFEAIRSAPLVQREQNDATKFVLWVQQIRKRLHASVTFFFVLGCTWIFGILMLISDHLELQYPFVILNSLQGLWIFMTHCMNDPILKASFTGKVEKRQLSRHLTKYARDQRSSGPSNSSGAARSNSNWRSKRETQMVVPAASSDSFGESFGSLRNLGNDEMPGIFRGERGRSGLSSDLNSYHEAGFAQHGQYSHPRSVSYDYSFDLDNFGHDDLIDV